MGRADVQQLIKALDEANIEPVESPLIDVAKQLEKLVKANEAQVRLARAEAKKEVVTNLDALEKIASEVNKMPTIDMQPVADAIANLDKPQTTYVFTVSRNQNGFIQTITAKPR